jgi:peptidoglycan/xylan/chitin deacetylase (PgdA/CDA1 family)
MAQRSGRERVKALLRSPLAAALRLATRMSARRVGMGVVFHTIAASRPDEVLELAPRMAPAVFRAQVRHLARHYRVVPATGLLSAVAARRRGQRLPVAITFDDEMREHVEIAAPALAELGLHATFFVMGASLDEPFDFWWERMQARLDEGADAAALSATVRAALPPGTVAAGATVRGAAEAIRLLEPGERDAVTERLFARDGATPRGGMSRGDVTDLVRHGFAIGFHTRRHDTLTRLDDEALARAMEDGRAELAEIAGGPLTLIAYPHGVADARVASAARAAGFELGFMSHPHLVTPASDPLGLGRLDPPTQSVGHMALALARALRQPGGAPGPW